MASWEVATNRRRGGNKNNLSNNNIRDSASSDDEAKVLSHNQTRKTQRQKPGSNMESNIIGRKGGDHINGFSGNSKIRTTEYQYKEIYVPTKSVGRVVGKGGSKIKELHTSCECKIVILKQTGDEETLIKLIGNNDQISKAEESINQIIKEKIVSVRSKFTSDEENHKKADGKQGHKKKWVPDQFLKKNDMFGARNQQPLEDDRVLPTRARFLDFRRLY